MRCEEAFGVGGVKAVDRDVCRGRGWWTVVLRSEPRRTGGGEMWTACERELNPVIWA